MMFIGLYVIGSVFGVVIAHLFYDWGILVGRKLRKKFGQGE